MRRRDFIALTGAAAAFPGVAWAAAADRPARGGQRLAEPKAAATPAVPAGAPLALPNLPTGLSTVSTSDELRIGQLFDTTDPLLNAYANPNTSGVTFRTSWADIEPGDGSFDFSKLDTVFAGAEKGGKWVELILIPGFGTPAWAMQGVQGGLFAIPYGPGNGKVLPLPVPWDATYQSRWAAFLKAVAARYAARPSFRKIAAAGPTSVSAEMSLPDGANDIAQWEKFGYTAEKYVAAWQQTFALYAATFPAQFFSLALHPALPIPKGGKRPDPRDQIVADGLKYPRQFALQADGLDGNGGADKYGYTAVEDYSGKIATGFMMQTSASVRPTKVGPAGDPAKDLQAAVDKGLARNKAGRTIAYLEIYEPDIVNPAMQAVLQAAQQRLASGR